MAKAIQRTFVYDLIKNFTLKCVASYLKMKPLLGCIDDQCHFRYFICIWQWLLFKPTKRTELKCFNPVYMHELITFALSKIL